MSAGSFKNSYLQTIRLQIIYILLYTYQQDLVLNNLQELICRKRQPTNQPTNYGLNRSFLLFVLDQNT